MLYALLVILLVLMSVFLIGVVLIQSGRGDGLSGAFGMGEGQAVFGDRAGDVLTKATSWAAILFMILCLAVTWQSRRSEESLLSGRGSPARAARNAPLMTMEEMEEMERNAKDEAQELKAEEEITAEEGGEVAPELDSTSDGPPGPNPVGEAINIVSGTLDVVGQVAEDALEPVADAIDATSKALDKTNDEATQPVPPPDEQ